LQLAITDTIIFGPKLPKMAIVMRGIERMGIIRKIKILARKSKLF